MASKSLIEHNARIAEILESSEGLKNPAMARELALRSDMSATAARELLAKAPADNPFLKAMNQHGPVGVQAQTATVGGDKREARIAEIKKNVGKRA